MCWRPQNFERNTTHIKYKYSADVCIENICCYICYFHKAQGDFEGGTYIAPRAAKIFSKDDKFVNK